MTTVATASLCPPPSPLSVDGGSSMDTLAEILRIREARQQQHEQCKTLKPKRKAKLNKSISERHVGGTTSRGMSLSSHLAQPPRKDSFYEETTDDDKSATSYGSMSSCGSIDTIGSTNSMDDKRKALYNTRKIQSERHLVREPSRIPSSLLSIKKQREDDDDEDDRGASNSMLRSIMSHHNRQSSRRNLF